MYSTVFTNNPCVVLISHVILDRRKRRHPGTTTDSGVGQSCGFGSIVFEPCSIGPIIRNCEILAEVGFLTHSKRGTTFLNISHFFVSATEKDTFSQSVRTTALFLQLLLYVPS